MSFIYPYLDECAARLNAMLPRFPEIARFEVTNSDGHGEENYIHAIVSDRIKDSQRRNQIAAATLNRIAEFFPARDFPIDPEVVAKKHNGVAGMALEFYGKQDLIDTVAALEASPAHFRPATGEIARSS